MWVSGEGLVNVWRVCLVSSGCLEGVLRVSGKCLEGISRVSGGIYGMSEWLSVKSGQVKLRQVKSGEVKSG